MPSEFRVPGLIAKDVTIRAPTARAKSITARHLARLSTEPKPAGGVASRYRQSRYSCPGPAHPHIGRRQRGGEFPQPRIGQIDGRPVRIEILAPLPRHGPHVVRPPERATGDLDHLDIVGFGSVRPRRQSGTWLQGEGTADWRAHCNQPQRLATARRLRRTRLANLGLACGELLSLGRASVAFSDACRKWPFSDQVKLNQR